MGIHCVLLQDRFDNTAKFNRAIIHDIPFSSERVLWAAYVYTKKRYGFMPEVYRTAEFSEDVDWNEFVHVPSLYVVDYEGSEYWPTEDQLKLARVAIDATELFYAEMYKQQTIISGFVRQEMAKNYGIDTCYMRLPSMSGTMSPLQVLSQLAK